MGDSISDVKILCQMFTGNSLGHGETFLTGEVRDDGKQEVICRTVYTPVTATEMLNHISGKSSIGVAPIMQDNNCYFGALDIDNYAYDMLDIVRAIYDFNLPLVPCYSKSRHLHLFIFFTEPAPAYKVQEILQWYRVAFACDPKTEIFPKQRTVASTSAFPSWINLPYFGNTRHMVGASGEDMALDYFIQRYNNNVMSIENHWSVLRELDFFEAPPCILRGILLRDVPKGQRNTWLFSTAVFYRLMDEHCDWQTRIIEINNSLHSPIGDQELQTTVIRSMENRSYFYKCSELYRCEKKVCQSLTYGVNSKASTGLDFGQLTRIMTDPPMYEWIVNGQKLRFSSNEELVSQRKFRSLAIDKLDVLPRMVKDDKWSAIVSRALENINIVQYDTVMGDFTSGSTLRDAICGFLLTKRRATIPTQIYNMDRVYEDKDEKEYVFTATALMRFLRTTDIGGKRDPIDIRNSLVDMGGYRSGSVWRISMDKANTPKVSDELDFEKEDTDDGTNF